MTDQKNIRQEETMQSKPTYAEIISSYSLWQKYADPMGTVSQQEFTDMGTDELEQILISCFGPETTDQDEN